MLRAALPTTLNSPIETSSGNETLVMELAFWMLKPPPIEDRLLLDNEFIPITAEPLQIKLPVRSSMPVRSIGVDILAGMTIEPVKVGHALAKARPADRSEIVVTT